MKKVVFNPKQLRNTPLLGTKSGLHYRKQLHKSHELYFNGEIYYRNMGSFDFTEKSIINLLTIKLEARYVHQINIESSFTESEKKKENG